mgnify:CR=1 FL=1|tara:strand:- start:3674 stop:4177 length:504 start_codon:yes stop_codon:yes gene_type:complete
MSNFWANPAIEPKRQHRWVVYVEDFDHWIAKKVTRPSFTVGETEHKFLNHSFWYPGRVTWDAIDLTIVDPGGAADSTAKLYFKLQQAGYFFPENPNVRSTISKALAVNSFGQMTIHELTPEGQTNNRFTIYNAWIQKAALGELDYEGEGMVDLTLTLRYDYAKYSLG